MGFYNLNSCFKKSIWLLRGKGVNPYEFLFRILPLIAKDFEFFDFLNFFFYFQGLSGGQIPTILKVDVAWGGNEVSNVAT